MLSTPKSPTMAVTFCVWGSFVFGAVLSLGQFCVWGSFFFLVFWALYITTEDIALLDGL
jgi:hypothetical protein